MYFVNSLYGQPNVIAAQIQFVEKFDLLSTLTGLAIGIVLTALVFSAVFLTVSRRQRATSSYEENSFPPIESTAMIEEYSNELETEQPESAEMETTIEYAEEKTVPVPESHLPNYCIVCGASNVTHSKFCTTCGTKF